MLKPDSSCFLVYDMRFSIDAICAGLRVNRTSEIVNCPAGFVALAVAALERHHLSA
jgi:hypothetical protein